MSTSTSDLMASVIGEVEAAASGGDPTAVGSLTGMAGSVGTTGGPGTGVGTKPKVANLKAVASRITRPNGETYRTRKMGAHNDVTVLRRAREKGIFSFGYGAPGTGKTALVEAAFCGDDLAESDRGMETVQGTGDTMVADFVGSHIQLPGGLFQWVDGPLLIAMEAGIPLYVDEVPLIDPKVMAIVYGVMDGRDELRVTDNPERGTVKAAPGFYVTSSGNPNAPGANMSEALLSRFKLQFEVTTDYVMSRDMGVPAKVVTVANNMNSKMQNNERTWAPQMRELLAFIQLREEFGEDFALANLVSNAPEHERADVADLLTRGLGRTSAPLTELRLT